MKRLNNLPITAKLGILVGVILLGLAAAGAMAMRLVSQEMLRARMDQTHAIVDTALNMAKGLQKRVEAGELTKDAAREETLRRWRALPAEERRDFRDAEVLSFALAEQLDFRTMGNSRKIILSWLIVFNVLNTRSPGLNAFVNGLERITAPIYRPIRRMMPDFGGIDFSPLVVIIIIQILHMLLDGAETSLITGTL